MCWMPLFLFPQSGSESLSFPKLGIRGGADPLDPLFCNEMSFIQSRRADPGVGCGPGGTALQKSNN